MAMTTRRTSALPIPQAELDRMRNTLSPTYGSQVWEGAGARILVVRVPRPEPDLVTDIEAAVDYLSPGDTQQLTAALLVGDTKAHIVPTQPFAQLMEERVNFDIAQARELRKRLAPGTHLIYRAPGDSRKVVRLGLRLNSPTVSDLGDDELTQWGATLGAELNSGKLSGVRAVYLVADKDEVRLDADLFLQDLRHRLAEANERKLMAQKLAAKQATTARPPAGAAATGRVAYAPIRSINEAEDIDAAIAQSERHSSQASPLVAAIEAALANSGFDVLVAPSIQHPVDLAGERTEGDVQRVIIRTPERLTLSVAQEVLATCRAVDTDLALVICAEADPDARKRLIATKARWMHPDDLPNLRL